MTHDSIKRFATALSAGAAMLATCSAFAYDAGDWLIKGRLANIDPDAKSGPVVIGGAPVPGSGVDVDDGLSLDISIAYMLDPYWAVELLLDITSKHDVTATGATLGGLGKIAEVRALPPTLLLQYHFLPTAKIRPYVGAGVNYTDFRDEKTSDSFNGALGGPSDIGLDSSWGLAAQAGVDIDLTNGWFLTLDLKWIDIDTTAKINSPSGAASVDIDLDPWVYGIGLGRAF